MAPSRYLRLPESRLASEAIAKALDQPRSFARTCGGVLVVAGPSGSGKSSLIGACWARLPKSAVSGNRPRVVRTSAERWCDDFQSIERDGKLADWVDRQSQPKVWIVEDVEVFRRTRYATAADQFCGVVDRIVGRGDCVILSVDDSPSHLPVRLADRAAGGLMTAIDPLSLASRATLAQRFCESRGLLLSDPHAETIAEVLGETSAAVREDIADLERLTINSGGNLDSTLVAEFVRRRSAGKPTIPAIAKAVAREYSARVSDLRASGRSQSVVLPRQAAMFLARKLAGEPYQAIGDYFGNRNHSTVVHSVKRIESLMADGDELAGRISAIRAQLAS